MIAVDLRLNEIHRVDTSDELARSTIVVFLLQFVHVDGFPGIERRKWLYI